MNPASLSTRKNCSVMMQLATKIKSPDKIPVTASTLPKTELMYLERKQREGRELDAVLKQDRIQREQAKRQRLHRSAATIQAVLRGQMGKRLARWQAFGVQWSKERHERLRYGQQEAERFLAARERLLHPAKEEPTAAPEGDDEKPTEGEVSSVQAPS